MCAIGIGVGGNRKVWWGVSETCLLGIYTAQTQTAVLRE
jgi:hypothetical protein